VRDGGVVVKANLVGVTGKAGAGKDLIADRLVAIHGYTRVALADPMKVIARDLFGFTHDQLWGSSGMRNAPDPRWTADRHNFTGRTEDGSAYCPRCGEPSTTSRTCQITTRHVLQQLGTQWGRAMHEDLWVRDALRTAKALLAGGHRYSRELGLQSDPAAVAPMGVVIPDCRFQNEALAITEAGGWILRVFRPGAGLTGVAGQHASEAGLADCLVDVDLINGGTIEHLERMVDTTMDSYARERMKQAG